MVRQTRLSYDLGEETASGKILLVTVDVRQARLSEETCRISDKTSETAVERFYHWQ